MRNQIEIGSSDAKAIMRGDLSKLWRIKKGIDQPEDLTWKLPVQVGIATEALNRRFYENAFNRKVVAPDDPEFAKVCAELGIPCLMDATRDPLTYLTWHPKREWQVCHLDGFVRINGQWGVWEGKTTGEISNWNDELRVTRTNWWQFVHQMAVHNVPFVEVSVIYGNGNAFKQFRIERNQNEEDILIGKQIEFMAALVENIEPVDTVEVATTSEASAGGDAVWIKHYKQKDLEALKIKDDDFKALASDFLANEKHAKIFEKAKKDLKGLMPEDAKTLTAHGVVVGRSANGSITIKQEKKEKTSAKQLAAE
jgi:hypothetical protein